MNDFYRILNEGYSAFPVTEADGSVFKGMTLVDWFAGQIIAGHIANSQTMRLNSMSPEEMVKCAKQAYNLAFTMVSRGRGE